MSQPPSGYTVLETLFSNDRTMVQRAVRDVDNLSVILKSFRSDQPSASQLQRFLFSYDVASRFNHNNILRTVDYIDAGVSSVMVLEDCRSVDLRQFAQTFPDCQLPLETFLIIAVQLAEALSHIHHEQVIHKDLHPGNILINPDSLQVKIIDFGLASLLSREQPALALPEKLEGVLAYISPEQTGRMNRALDYRTDFYTLGVTLYELLTGSVPFVANDALGLVHAHIAKQQKSVAKRCPNIPEIVSEIIDKLLSKTAESRYQSAQGLKRDLEKCQRALRTPQVLPVFTLGVDDISDRLQLPQILYGRETEINVLLSNFKKSAEGAPQLLTVSGYSGIGKSALVHEVHKPIAERNGLFISGKFDQFQRNIPYSALQQALREWLQYALAVPGTVLESRRQALIEQLGANARVLTDFMVEFVPLLGVLPDIPLLGAEETKNRFYQTIAKLLTWITSDKPLVIFLDDLQWADRGTLNLLPVLMDELDCHLLVIAAYRDNEVSDVHPAIQTIHLIQEKQSEHVSSVMLGPLPLKEINQLLEDGLHQSSSDVQKLACLIQEKTGGNPFFINEFLKTLYSEELLNFDLERHCWQWDMAAVESKGITDNVVELMLGKMRKLPGNTQQILQLASCIGSCFDIEMVAMITERPIVDITNELWPALVEGFLIQEGGDWLLGGDGISKTTSEPINSISSIKNNTECSTGVALVRPQCRFIHDRMLQAAYESINGEDRKRIHLSIGRLLRSCSADRTISLNWSFSTSLFVLVEQLNLGRDLIVDLTEKLELIRLNIKAAEKSKLAGVWDAVVQYTGVALSLLPENCWDSHFSLTFDATKLKAEAEYLRGSPDESDRLYDELLGRADDVTNAEICVNRLVENIGRGRWQVGVSFGLSGLRYLGVEIPQEPNEIADLLLKEELLFDELSKKTPIDDITQLNLVSDRRLLIAMQIYSNLNACGFITGDGDFLNLSIFRGLNLMLQFGRSPLTAIQLAWYALWLTRKRDYRNAIEVAEQALLINQHFQESYEISNCYNILASMVLIYGKPYVESIKLHQKGYEIGLENGEVARSSINYANILLLKLSMGENLVSVRDYANLALGLGKRKSIFLPVAIIIKHYVDALIDSSAESSKALDNQAFPRDFQETIKGSQLEYNLIHCRSKLEFWCGEYKNAISSAKIVHQSGYSQPKFSDYPDHLVIYALLIISEESKTPCSSEHLQFCLEELDKLAELCSSNFNHKYHLLLAEQARYQNKPMEDVVPYYESAIESAKANHFIQYHALACELFGGYWLSKGVHSLARNCLQDALDLYRQWGCQARIDYLKHTHGNLISTPPAGSVAEQSLTASFRTHSTQITSSTDASKQGSSELDFDSILKSAQVISSELKLKQLAIKLIELVAENVGAQKAALVLDGVNGPVVEAIISSQSDSNGLQDDPELLSERLSKASQPLILCEQLPENVINYVLRTNETLNINDVTEGRTFSGDLYLKRYAPQSILCVPVDYRDDQIGVLYLENQLTTDAFDKGRLNVVNTLVSQAAISIENARLFEEVRLLNIGLEKKVKDRTQQLAMANQQLEQSNNDLQSTNDELKTFSYTISHDLRAPLRGIKGFSEILLEDKGDQLDEEGKQLLHRLIDGAHRMSDLIDGLLALSEVQKKSVEMMLVNLSVIAKGIFSELSTQYPNHQVNFICADGIEVMGDSRLLYSALENLLNNAWKYTARTKAPEVEFGIVSNQIQSKGIPTYFVKDNGAGFDPNFSHNLFAAFGRLHKDSEFPGTGIGLATVKRIINKHGGDIWAEGSVNQGAIFYFTLP